MRPQGQGPAPEYKIQPVPNIPGAALALGLLANFLKNCPVLVFAEQTVVKSKKDIFECHNVSATTNAQQKNPAACNW